MFTISTFNPLKAVHYCNVNRRLLMEIDGFKGSGSTSSSASDKSKQQLSGTSTNDGGNVTYQLFYRPEQAKFSNNARVRVYYFIVCQEFWVYLLWYISIHSRFRNQNLVYNELYMRSEMTLIKICKCRKSSASFHCDVKFQSLSLLV